MKKDDVISYLSDCDLAELAGILNSVLPLRSKELNENDIEIEINLVLAEVSRFSDQENWGFSIVSKPNTENENYKVWEFGKGEPFVQEGECMSCKVKLCSHAKEVICPLCRGVAHLT